MGDEADISLPDVGKATVARTANGLELVAATPEPGWQVTVEVAAGRELELSFRSDGVRHDINIQLEDGQIRVRARTRAGQIEDNVDAGSNVIATDSSTSSTSSTSTTTSTTLAPLPAGATPKDVAVLDAGSVSYAVDGLQLLITDVSTNDRWSATGEVSFGREVEVSFRNGEARVDLNLELEDDQVRIRIRDRRTDSRTETLVPATGPTTSLPSSSTPPEPIEHTANSVGGTVVVSVSGDVVLLVSSAAADGYVTEIREAGPDEVDVRFESSNAESRVGIRVQDGQIRQMIEDR